MPAPIRLMIGLTAAATERLRAQAQSCHLSPQRLAKQILETHFSGAVSSPAARDSATAEAALLHWVGKAAADLKRTDCWDEHVTRDIFERIRTEQADLYAAATRDGGHRRVNRAIGMQVREALGATVQLVGSKRLVGRPPNPEEALIRTYTMLFRRDEAAADV